MKLIVFIVLGLPLVALAQNKSLSIEGTAPNFYLSHIVAPKENYYSIGRLYNISPKEIAPFNKLDLAKGLTLSQPIKVPLTTNNFSQSNSAAADEVLVPVYYTVKEKEGLYHISSEYNKLPLATLKQWNNISGDAVANGTKLIVGYLKVKKDLSALSSQAKTLPATAIATPVNAAKEAGKTPVTKEPEMAEKSVAKDKTPAVSVTKPAAVTESAGVKKDAVAVVSKDNVPATKQETKTWSGRSFNKAYFKPDYDKQTKASSLINESGTAAVFKSTSGWEDGKYYCLHNNAAPGSIIKITSNLTGKAIYAKVLDIMPDIKQNTDLMVRLSNAAAEELGVGENKFDCVLSYAK